MYALGYLSSRIFFLNNGEGDYEKAETLFKRALEIYEKALGPDHPYVAETLFWLGSLLYICLLYTSPSPRDS